MGTGSNLEKDSDIDLISSNHNNLDKKITNTEDKNDDCDNFNCNINSTKEIKTCSPHKTISGSEVLNLANDKNKEFTSPSNQETASENNLSNFKSRKQTKTKKKMGSRSLKSKASTNQTEGISLPDPECNYSQKKPTRSKASQTENKSTSVSDPGNSFRRKRTSRVQTYSNHTECKVIPDSDSNSRKVQTTSNPGGANNQDEREDLTMPFATLADLKRPKYDIKIDPNAKASFTYSPPSQRSPSPPESPETKRKRLEEQARFFERHGRLHPSNNHLNQGPVVNPPLISPATMVGYSPGGQRYEFDLNTDRPTRFNSEYDRRMYDNAMRINVSKMLLELSDGSYLPPSLDPNIERRYYEEARIIKEEATIFFEQCAADSANNDEESQNMTESEDQRHMALLDAEQKLLELVGHAEIKLADFPEQMSTMLYCALQLDMSAVMLKKNPIILEVLDKLTRSTNRAIKDPAESLLCKAKALFDVPSGQTFKEHYLTEVEKFKEETDHMSAFQLMVTTNGPVEESEGSGVDVEDDTVSAEDGVREDLQPTVTEIGNISPSSTEADVWIPVKEGELYEDLTDSEDTTVVYVNEPRPSRWLPDGWDLAEVDEDEVEVQDENEINLMLAQLLESEDVLDSDSEEEFFSLMERIHEE